MGREARLGREAVADEVATMPTLLPLGLLLDGLTANPAYPRSLAKKACGMVAVLQPMPAPRFNLGPKPYPMTVARTPWSHTPVASRREVHANSRHLMVWRFWTYLNSSGYTLWTLAGRTPS